MSAELSFLVIETDNRWFALPTALVESAVAPRAVTALPFVPRCVEGLVNVNERILPLVDLRLLLGGAAPTAGGELVVIDAHRAPCALRVERVVGKADIEAGNLQEHAGDDGANIVSGRFDWDSRAVLVLDDNALARVVGSHEVPQGDRGLLGRLQAEENVAGHDTLDTVVFEAAGELYAIDLQDAIEILDLPPATAVPGAPAVAEGLARVRDDVILVLSFPRLLRRGENRADAPTVIVVERDGVRYGLRVDRLDGIRAFARDALRRIDDDGGELVGVLAGDDRLFGLVTPARLIGETLHTALKPLVPRRHQEDAMERDTLHPVLQVALGDEDFAIPLAQVRRIAEYCPAEPLRDSEHGLVTGAVTVDGNVMPVIELGSALRAGGGNTGAWVIVGEEGREWAIAVREAKQILEIPGRAIEEISARADGFVTAVANVDNRLLSLLTMAPLLRGDAGTPATSGQGSVTHGH